MHSMWLALIFAATVVLTDGRATDEFSRNNGTSSLNFGRYKVYQIRPRTEEQLKQLELFEQQGIVDFWHMPFTPNATADVMLDEGRQEVQQFHKFIQQFGIDSKVLVEDLAKFIEQKEIRETNSTRKFGQGGKWQRDSTMFGNQRANSFGITMGEYHSYDEILAFMSRIERQLPADTVQLRSIGKSAEGRDIRGIQFGKPRDFTRQVVWIDAGIHSREWTAIHTAVYFTYYIANEMVANPTSPLVKYLQVLDVLILPCVNPDGYEYTRSDPRNPSVRFWRKSRSQERCDTDSQNNRRCCRGVDLNRNFDFRFAETGTSYFPCSEIYHGSGPFSEPETKAIRDAVLLSDLHGRIPAMVTMHAYSQLWTYPFSHRKHSYPADIAELVGIYCTKAVARRAVDAIGEKFGTHYMTGTGPEIIYAYAGGSADWAKQTAGIKYTYTIELRPSYWSWNGFILEKAQLIPTAKETFDGIMVVLETVYEKVLANAPAKPVTAATVMALSTAIPTVRTVNPTVNTPSFQQKPVIFSAECRDRVAFCKQWLSKHPHLCLDSPSNMKRDCASSCSMC